MTEKERTDGQSERILTEMFEGMLDEHHPQWGCTDPNHGTPEVAYALAAEAVDYMHHAEVDQLRALLRQVREVLLGLSLAANEAIRKIDRQLGEPSDG